VKENKCVKKFRLREGGNAKFYCSTGLDWDECSHYEENTYNNWCKFTCGEFDQYCTHGVANLEAEIVSKLEEI